MKVIEKEDCLQFWPAGGATAQLHQPHVASWLFRFGFLPLCPFSFCQNDFPLLGRFLASLSSFPLSSLHQLWNASYVPGVDPGTTLVATIEACGVSVWDAGMEVIWESHTHAGSRSFGDGSPDESIWSCKQEGVHSNPQEP